MDPLSLSQVSLDRGYFGREAREIFNAELADAGFVTTVERRIWGSQIAPYRRLVRAVSDEVDVGGVSELGGLNALAARAADVLAVTWGGAPEVIAGAVEVWDGARGGWRTLSVSVGGGTSQSSIVRRVLPDDVVLEEDHPGELWAASGRDQRIALWLSLFRGLSRDRAWDRRVFRAYSLLEAVGSEVAPSGVAVTDRNGDGLSDRRGEVATTRTSRGKAYWTVQQSLLALELPDALLLAHPSRTLWAEVGVWVDVRNAVAHEGCWPQPPLPTRSESRRDEVAEAFAAAAGSGGLEDGWTRYSERSCAAVELVLRALLKGHLIASSP